MKNTTIIIFLILLLTPLSGLLAQGEGNIWFFGLQRIGLDFNNEPPTLISSSDNIEQVQVSTICNADGELLFYTNGYWVWNAEHYVFPELVNGATNITTPATYSPYYTPIAPGFLGSHPSIAITNVPGQENKYYIFKLLVDMGQIFYTMVDMELNGGLGGIVPGKKGLILATNISKKLTVVEGCNNIWLMTQSRLTSEFMAFEINEYGINFNPVRSDVGLLPPIWYSNSLAGSIKFSPDRKKMYSTNHTFVLDYWWGSSYFGGLELFDFNPNTGKLSNPMLINSSDTFGYFTSASFSPDNSKLYLLKSSFNFEGSIDTGVIFQYDVSLGSAEDIISSKTTVYTHIIDINKTSEMLKDIQIAPNGKLYFVDGSLTSNTHNYLYAIHNPNEAGIACNADPYAIYLGERKFSGYYLPNAYVILPPPVWDSVYRTQYIDVCFASQALLATEPGKHYQWSTGDTSKHIIVTESGQYTVHYVDTNCQYHIDTFNVHFSFPEFHLNALGCTLQHTGQLSVILPYDSMEYTWYDVEDNIITQRWKIHGDTLSHLPAGIYKLHITNHSGCDTTLYAEIQELPQPSAAMNADTLVCKGDTLYYSGITDGVNAYWDFGNQHFAEGLEAINKYHQSGKYTLSFTAISAEACSNTIYQTINVKELDLNLEADRYSLQFGEKVQLAAYSNQEYNILSWQPFMNFESQHNYRQSIMPDSSITIIVEGISSEGCKAVDSVAIIVSALVLMPDAFSPNGDGVNDYFIPVSSSRIEIIQFQIFNRYGELVYSANGRQAAKGWDGRYKGKLVDIGTYYYKIIIDPGNKKLMPIKGDVIVIK